MGILSSIKSGVSKAYTNVDKSVFKGALPGGAPKQTSQPVSQPKSQTPLPTPVYSPVLTKVINTPDPTKTSGGGGGGSSGGGGGGGGGNGVTVTQTTSGGAKEIGGVTVTDYVTGESIKTITSPGGSMTGIEYRPSPTGGERLINPSAVQQINQELNTPAMKTSIAMSDLLKSGAIQGFSQAPLTQQQLSKKQFYENVGLIPKTDTPTSTEFFMGVTPEGKKFIEQNQDKLSFQDYLNRESYMNPKATYTPQELEILNAGRMYSGEAMSVTAGDIASVATGAYGFAKIGALAGTNLLFSSPISKGISAVIDFIAPSSDGGFSLLSLPKQVLRGGLFLGATPIAGTAYAKEFGTQLLDNPIKGGKSFGEYALKNPYEIGTISIGGAIAEKVAPTKFGLNKGELKELEKISRDQSAAQLNPRYWDLRLKAGQNIKNTKVLNEFNSKFAPKKVSVPTSILESTGGIEPGLLKGKRTEVFPSTAEAINKQLGSQKEQIELFSKIDKHLAKIGLPSESYVESILTRSPETFIGKGKEVFGKTTLLELQQSLGKQSSAMKEGKIPNLFEDAIVRQSTVKFNRPQELYGIGESGKPIVIAKLPKVEGYGFGQGPEVKSISVSNAIKKGSKTIEIGVNAERSLYTGKLVGKRGFVTKISGRTGEINIFGPARKSVKNIKIKPIDTSLGKMSQADLSVEFQPVTKLVERQSVKLGKQKVNPLFIEKGGLEIEVPKEKGYSRRYTQKSYQEDVKALRMSSEDFEQFVRSPKSKGTSKVNLGESITNEAITKGKPSYDVYADARAYSKGESGLGFGVGKITKESPYKVFGTTSKFDRELENALKTKSPRTPKVKDEFVTLYHGTTKDSAARALREGLKPASEVGISRGLPIQLPEVFGTPELSRARGWAGRAYLGKGKPTGGGTAVLQAKIPKGEFDKLFVRRSMEKGGGEEVALKEIPAKYLSSLEGLPKLKSVVSSGTKEAQSIRINLVPKASSRVSPALSRINSKAVPYSSVLGLPLIVGGAGGTSAMSSYAGKGMYEPEPMFSVPKSVSLSVNINKQTPTNFMATNTSQTSAQVPKEIFNTKTSSGSADLSINAEVPKEIQKIFQNPVQKPAERTTQREIQRTIQQPKMQFRFSPRQTPNQIPTNFQPRPMPRIRLHPPVPNTNKKSSKMPILGRRGRAGGFIPELRRFGKFKPVGKATSFEQALGIGKTAARQTLGASVRLRKVSGGFAALTPSQEFRFGKAGRDTTTLVQLSRTRLSSAGEKFEILKSRKGGNFL